MAESSPSERLRVGVLALQGDFHEHIEALGRLGVEAFAVRLPRELAQASGLIVPGGESTTITRLMRSFGLEGPLRDVAHAGIPIWGTCAGMIVLAREASDLPGGPLGLIDIAVQRNAFGRQVDSFEADLAIQGLNGNPFHAVFIRAPVITATGQGVEVLARLADGTPVAARQERVLVTAFHPELTDDPRVHALFLRMVREEAAAQSQR